MRRQHVRANQTGYERQRFDRQTSEARGDEVRSQTLGSEGCCFDMDSRMRQSRGRLRARSTYLRVDPWPIRRQDLSRDRRQVQWTVHHLDQ